MVINIPNDADLYHFQMALQCENKSIISLLRNIQAHYSKEPSIEVQINPDLVSDGYKVNPSQFAKNAHTQYYTYTRGFNRDDLIVLLFTNNPMEGESFITQLKNFIVENEYTESIEFPFESIPESYRFRPEQVRYRIKQMTGYKLVTRKTKTSWVFRRAKA